MGGTNSERQRQASRQAGRQRGRQESSTDESEVVSRAARLRLDEGLITVHPRLDLLGFLSRQFYMSCAARLVDIHPYYSDP